MTDKQIKLDGSWIPMEEAIKAGLISENDIKKEQIIIDGVDVSGCDELVKQDDNILICEITGYLCDDRQNCYYKQLKRSEAQCEAMFVTHTDLEKKYKAKEQECERLEYEVGSLENDRDILHDESDQLKAQLLDQEAETLKAGGIIETLTKENEQLKKQACGLRPELKYIIDKTCCKYHINAKYYHEKIVEIINNLDKYTQTLIEIKEIARVNSINTCWTAINLCADCDEIKECGLQSPFEKLKAIIQKISECEG